MYNFYVLLDAKWKIKYDLTHSPCAFKDNFEKTKRFSKKYLYICGVVLVVAIISVGVAYLLSTNKISTQVQEGVNELPSKEFMRQVFGSISNTSIEKVQTKMDLLSKGKQYYCLLYNLIYVCFI